VRAGKCPAFLAGWKAGAPRIRRRRAGWREGFQSHHRRARLAEPRPASSATASSGCLLSVCEMTVP